MKLTPEMIPRTSFFSNLRSMLSKEKWDSLRKACYKSARYKCEICSGRGNEHPVECHEVWDYNEKTAVQKLVRLIALCPSCHEVVHFGLAGVQGRTKQAMEHLKKVNDLSDVEAQSVVNKAWRVWTQRNKTQWTLDITAVTGNTNAQAESSGVGAEKGEPYEQMEN